MLPTGLLSAPAHAERRNRLMHILKRPVLLMGNGPLPRNLPMNTLPFRQDSNLLYFTGCDLPNAAALITESGCTLFLPLPAKGDALWHGLLPDAQALKAHFGVDTVLAAEELVSTCSQFDTLATLAVSDPIRNAITESITGEVLKFGETHGDLDLVDAIIEMRRIKSPAEAQAHREAARFTTRAHCVAMGATRVGGHEREIAALFDGVLAANGCVNGYHSSVTVRGEILHNPSYNNHLRDGDLLLLDGGAELPSGYGADVTRTWPVNGRFSPRQRAAYSAVLYAQKESIALCREGVRYREVHLASSKILAQFLVDEGLLMCSASEAFETGAHALFFPHGVGHFLGLDVHDLEQFGDRPAYPEDRQRDPQFGLSYLRLDMTLEAGHLVTVEPGFYVVDAILDDPVMQETHKGRLNLDALEAWRGFGGIRIEDDILVGPNGPENLSAAAPREIEAIEEKTGTSLEAAARFLP
jgi:Xaa-Pro aminopeptidase